MFQYSECCARDEKNRIEVDSSIRSPEINFKSSQKKKPVFSKDSQSSLKPFEPSITSDDTAKLREIKFTEIDVVNQEVVRVEGPKTKVPEIKKGFLSAQLNLLKNK